MRARRSTTPKEMAKKLVRILRPERPNYAYLKKVFQHTREMLEVTRDKVEKRLPELLTNDELMAFYDAVWHARHRAHMIMLKLLIFTGMRNAELAKVCLKDVNLDMCQV